MPPDATATKSRLLAAAYQEFARFGLAGARVDRIAQAAQANKRLIYVHFGNKDQLFDLVVARGLTDLADAVPFTATDLPEYAGAVFDYLLENPELLRLTRWAQLERPDATAAEIEAYRPKVEALQSRQQDGMVMASSAPTDLLAVTLALATAWADSSPALRSLATQPPWSDARLQEHRTAMIRAVAAVTSPDAASR